MTHARFVCAFLVAGGVLAAQSPPPAPIYRIHVTARTAKAVSYQNRSGSTKVDFRGTDLLPGATGVAKVDSKQGHIQIEAEFDGLQPATRNGAEYLTYVLWAITPEGRTANLGEVLLNGAKSKLNVTTDLQVFALVVTAEPYFAVTQPSDLVVMENQVRSDTRGKTEEIDAKYELLQRGQYHGLANPLELRLDSKQPLELYEARNAVQIARSAGADRFAAETFQKAEKSLAQAEAYQARNAGRKPVTMAAREAVQTSEDAKVIAVKRQEADSLAAERQQSGDREARAESGRAAAQTETERVTREAEVAKLKAQADTERLTREKDAQATASLAEAGRVKLANDTQAANSALEADRLKRANDAQMANSALEADRLKRANDAERDANQTELALASRQKAQLEIDKVTLRIALLQQFNAILQTRDTTRGLIVNMSDVLFDTGKFSLRPLAREKLAKVAGIVSGHPGLRLDVEGYTDSVGGDDYNQQLSEHRGESVRDYLVGQGMAAGSVSSNGFGKAGPVASNDTAEGRQQNRRVELVISGEIIGTEIGTPIAIR